MKLKNRNFPYPVLTNNSDDYPEDTFNVNLQFELKGGYLNIQLDADITNPDLKRLIREGKAEYVYLLECPLTMFRKAYRTNESHKVISLRTTEVANKVFLNPMIVVSEAIQNFCSDRFHEDYEGITFDLQPGNILAAAPSFDIYVDKSNEELGDTESIFSISRTTDEGVHDMKVVYDSTDKIIICLPNKAYQYYGTLNKNPDNYPILNSLVIVPALFYVLSALIKEAKDTDLDYEYGDRKWYRQLNKAMKDQFKFGLGSEEFASQTEVFSKAQQLAQSPLEDALKRLTEDQEQEDDEE